MKRLFALISICALSFGAHAQIVKAELEVSGLTCSMCSLSTQKSLKTLDFMGEIRPDLNKNIFYLTFKPGKAVSLDAIQKKVLAAGFSVSKLVAVTSFSSLQVSNNLIFPIAGTSYQFENVQSRTLDGETRVLVIDKSFIPSRAYKKYSTEIKDPSYASGRNDKNERIIHITLI